MSSCLYCPGKPARARQRLQRFEPLPQQAGRECCAPNRTVKAHATVPVEALQRAFATWVDRVTSTSDGARLSSFEGISWYHAQLHRVVRFLQSLQRNDTSRSRFFEGAAEPVSSEIFSDQLEVVEGAVPECLEGAYARTGPNPQHTGSGLHGGYVMVDGEAMVHAVAFSGGQAKTYANHWLRCARFEHERKAGQNLYLRIGDLVGWPGLLILLLTQLNPRMFPEPNEYLNYQLGNTSLTFHNGRLLALMEGGMPFHVRLGAEGKRLGVIESVGPFDFHGSMTDATSGHPKVCPRTGELHSFFYRVAAQDEEQHLCVYHVASADGKLSQDYPVDISRGQMMHDFAITENYAVFCDASVVFDPVHMLQNHALPFAADQETPSRIGLLCRSDATQPMQWFEVSTFAFFHTANAWEEDDGRTVRLVLCRFDTMDVSKGLRAGFHEVPEVYRYTLHLDTGAVEEECLVPGRNTEFPTVPPQLIGRPHKFCYCSVAEDVAGASAHAPTSASHIMKVDMTAPASEGFVAELHFGEGYVGGEASFVPRDAPALLAGDAAEDDGFLIAYVTDTASMESYCVIYDARTMSSVPVAKVRMPQRVPLGLHGTFLHSHDLATQVY